MKLTSFIIFVPFLLFLSCTDMLEEETRNQTAIEQYQSDLQTLSSILFDTLDVAEYENYYIVEKDIIISKQSLRNIKRTRQYHTTNRVKNLQNITIGIDASILNNSSWINAIKEVVDIYNSYSGLYIKYSGSENSDIIVSKKSLGTMYTCAQGEFPVSQNGLPGAHIYINNTFYRNIDTFLSHSQKVFLLMHELGHNIGLRHSDCLNNGEGTSNVGAIFIPGTLSNDSESYMKSSTCGKEWIGVPKYDEIALSYLFPYKNIFSIHFEDCENIDNIYFSKGQKVYLDRRLIPKREGYTFSGWHYAKQAYTPYSYNSPIDRSFTFYAKWRNREEPTVLIDTKSYNEKNIKFNVHGSSIIHIRLRIHQGLNSWSDLNYDPTIYFQLNGRTLQFDNYKIGINKFKC